MYFVFKNCSYEFLHWTLIATLFGQLLLLNYLKLDIFDFVKVNLTHNTFIASK